MDSARLHIHRLAPSFIILEGCGSGGDVGPGQIGLLLKIYPQELEGLCSSPLKSDN